MNQKSSKLHFQVFKNLAGRVRFLLLVIICFGFPGWYFRFTHSGRLEDVFPIENGDLPLLCWLTKGYILLISPGEKGNIPISVVQDVFCPKGSSESKPDAGGAGNTWVIECYLCIHTYIHICICI